MFSRRPFIAALFLAGVIMVTLPAHSLGRITLAAVRESANVAAVWEREEAYWRYAAAGDVQRYLDLWADGFRGWPSDQPHPVTKAGVADWIEKMRDQKIHMVYTLSREGAADFGDVVVIFYQAGIRLEHSDGRVEGRGEPLRMTHTWRRVGDAWRIIGGMAAAMPTQAPK